MIGAVTGAPHAPVTEDRSLLPIRIMVRSLRAPASERRCPMVSHHDASAAPTLWRMPDDLWEVCRRMLPPEKPPGTRGRPVVPFRQVLDGILHVLRTGCHWKAVPREFGSGSTIHARFQEWTRRGVWRRLWAEQLRRYDREHGIGWDRQSADSATVPSPPSAATRPG